MSRPAPGLRQTTAGTWEARYYGPGGERRSKTFRRKSDAVTFVAAARTDMRRGDWIDPRLSAVTFSDWAKIWSATTVHLKPATQHDYACGLRAHLLPAFGPRPLASLQPVDVQAWVGAMAQANTSAALICKSYRLLKMIFTAAVESDYIGRSPCRAVKLPRVQKPEMLFLTADQVEAVADTIPAPYGVLVRTLAYGGLRWGESAALRRPRCDLLHSRLKVVESASEVGGLHFGPTKNYETRTIVIPDLLREELARHMAGTGPGREDLVFTAPKGGPLRGTNFNHRIWTPELLASAGLPEELHELRMHDYADPRVMPTFPRNPLQGDVIAYSSSA
jgi:integrase